MKANTALCFLLAGLALAVPGEAIGFRIGTWLAALGVLAIGLLTLMESSTRWP